MGSAPPTKSCHNCRRRRRKCDLSVPNCYKCTSTGQECLGYGKLFLWNKGVASRGKMMGKSLGQSDGPANMSFIQQPKSLQHNYQVASHLQMALVDPLFQDLSTRLRFYLNYFQSQVCKDLVVYDLPSHNHFRDLLPLTKDYPVLLHIVVANSARHLSNAGQSIMIPSCQGSSASKKPGERATATNGISSSYHDALVSNQYALKLLGPALEATDPVGLDVALASILLFIEFELIDSGRGNWRIHVDGSRQLIDCISKMKDNHSSFLRESLISCCLIYDIVGTTLRTSKISTALQNSSIDIASILMQAEANNYMSCPAVLLEIMLHLPRLSQTPALSVDLSTVVNQGKHFLEIAEQFDPVKWAVEVQRTSPTSDLEKRIHIASAHKAAVRIYICRVIYPADQDTSPYETYVTEIIFHLSHIPSRHALFKATTWPTFIAGVETEDLIQREWVLTRLQEVWDLLPWGYVKSVINILEVIWGKKSQSKKKLNWLEELQTLQIDWFVG